MMKKIAWLVVLVVMLCSAAAMRADGNAFPSRPSPARCVNDLAGLFADSTKTVMEDSLQLLSKKKTAQVVVVTVNDLDGYTPNEFATKIGDEWGVGEKGTDNGVVILIKPKTKEAKGEVYIATGRGAEGCLPDAFCNKIIENEMIPALKEGNNYTKATWNALRVILPTLRGEYGEEKYDEEHEMTLTDWLFTLLCLCVVFAWPLYRAITDPTLGSGGNWTSGGGRGSGWSSGGGSSWSSGGGDFSFGGGSFGGGGAGGSW